MHAAGAGPNGAAVLLMIEPHPEKQSITGSDGGEVHGHGSANIDRSGQPRYSA
jgi:hypothetical protein